MKRDGRPKRGCEDHERYWNRYQTMMVYITTDDGVKTCTVASNIRYVDEDNDATIYSTELDTTIDLTRDI